MTRRPPAAVLILALVASLVTVASAAARPPVEECQPGVEAVRVDGLVLCTHGNDEAPPGVDTMDRPTVAELLEERFGTDDPDVVASEFDEVTTSSTGSVACVGNGVSGARVQLVYARAADVASRYTSVIPLLRQYASDADDMLNVSAGRVGDGRRVRYVTNSNCHPTVLNVKLSRTGDDSFGNMVSELRNKGLTNSDRKYLVFMDAAVGICGLGEVYMNDRGDELNPNNTGRAMYARVDTSCWKYAAAHELIHTLGSVQNSAPNSTGYGHCTDEVDVMCYRDHSTTVTRQVCSRSGQVDCRNNDYYHPNPKSGTYLAKKWNVARSRYLASTVAPPPPSATSVSIPSTVTAGVRAAVRASVATSNAKVVWSDTRKDCWFARPRALQTSWTCPATSTGAARITAHITEGGITTAYDADTVLDLPSPKRRASAGMRVLKKRIMIGRRLALVGAFNDMGTGAPIVRLRVVAQARPKGVRRWSRAAVKRTNANGRVRFVVKPRRNMQYRLQAVPNKTWARAFTIRKGVGVKVRLATRINRRSLARQRVTTVRSGRVVKIAGRVGPNKRGRVIRLRAYRNGKWRAVAAKRLNRRSGYVFRYRARGQGLHRLRVVKPGDRRHIGSRNLVRIRAR